MPTFLQGKKSVFPNTEKQVALAVNQIAINVLFD